MFFPLPCSALNRALRTSLRDKSKAGRLVIIHPLPFDTQVKQLRKTKQNILHSAPQPLQRLARPWCLRQDSPILQTDSKRSRPSHAQSPLDQKDFVLDGVCKGFVSKLERKRTSLTSLLFSIFPLVTLCMASKPTPSCSQPSVSWPIWTRFGNVQSNEFALVKRSLRFRKQAICSLSVAKTEITKLGVSKPLSRGPKNKCLNHSVS